jgi:hypothetical protein
MSDSQEIKVDESVGAPGTESVPVGTVRELSGILEVIVIAPFSEVPYSFELNAKEKLEVSFLSDVPIDVLLCDYEEYEGWADAGCDPEMPLKIYCEVLDGKSYTFAFITPRQDNYAVVLMNWTEETANVVVCLQQFLHPLRRCHEDQGSC